MVRAGFRPAGLAAGRFVVAAQSDWETACCLSKGSQVESRETAASLTEFGVDPRNTTRLLTGADCRIIKVLNRFVVGSRILARKVSGKVSAGGSGVRSGFPRILAAKYSGYRKARDFDGLRMAVR